MTAPLFSAVAILRYSTTNTEYRLVAEVDMGIVDVYRALVPRAVRLNRQKYAPHMTVVRREVPPNLSAWGCHEGKLVDFQYHGYVYFDHTYYWLGAYAPGLEEIRQELGLPRTSWVTESPDAGTPFHVTIGNVKPSV